MKFLIAGFGSIGRRHMRNLLALGERDIVLLRSRRSTLPTDELEGFQVETQIQAALEHRPDAVIIANPTALHLDVAIPAARAGCSIFIEKPISHNLDGIDVLESALRSAGGRLLVGFQFRYHPTLQKARQVLNDGEIGRPVSIRSHWGEYLPDWHPWEDYRQSYAAREELGGGVVRTLSHPLDYLRWLFGEVEQAAALTAGLPELELAVDSVADILLRFHSQAAAAVHLDFLQRPAQHTLDVTGTQGVLHWDNADGQLTWQRAGENEVHSSLSPEGFVRNSMFLEQMLHFIEVVKGTAEPACTLLDGRRNLELVTAVLESGRHGQFVRL